ncbi:DUF2277 domain-containing protein [Streptomyces sp. NPDC097619]|uniref:DUF2277 domain-containing protein n=1 Tax=Streptomyces sp. NPDC097619 TaxID=3157228 RepID=UPI0033329B3F
MCRSIKTLRPPALPEEATEEEMRAAALQYVRKVSGFRAPAAHNREVFDAAVEAVAEATRALLEGIEVRGGGRSRGHEHDHDHEHPHAHDHAHPHEHAPVPASA